MIVAPSTILLSCVLQATGTAEFPKDRIATMNLPLDDVTADAIDMARFKPETAPVPDAVFEGEERRREWLVWRGESSAPVRPLTRISVPQMGSGPEVRIGSVTHREGQTFAFEEVARGKCRLARAEGEPS